MYVFWQFTFFLSLDKVLGAITTAAERNNRERFSPVVEGLENHEFLQLQVGLVHFLIYACCYFCVLFSDILNEEMGYCVFFLTFKILFFILIFSRNCSQKFIWLRRILLTYSPWWQFWLIPGLFLIILWGLDVSDFCLGFFWE